MPKITNFAYCAEPRVDEQPRAINFLQTIEASNGNFSFSIIYTIAGFTASEDHTVHVVFSNPNGDELIETEKYVLEKEEDPVVKEKRLVTGISMGVEFKDVLFEGQGMYKMELFFDDEPLGEFHIPVLVKRGDE